MNLPLPKLIVVAVAFVLSVSTLACSDEPKQSLPLYAYGTSYLADDTSNTAGHRYIEQLNNAMRPSELHNFGRDGGTVAQIATAINDSWQSRNAVVVVDALTNNIYQTRNDVGAGIAAAEPIFRSMLQRLGAVPTVYVVMQGYFSGHDNELTNGQLPDATVDRWNSMVNRVVAGLPNVRIIDPNKGWEADRMMTNFHPNDVGEDHIAQLLFAALDLQWSPPPGP